MEDVIAGCGTEAVGRHAANGEVRMRGLRPTEAQIQVRKSQVWSRREHYVLFH